MSRPDSEAGDPTDEATTERLRRREAFAADLNARGYADVLVLRRESGRDVLTDRRLAVVRYLDRHGEAVESVSDLARRLDRDKGAVSKDLQRLADLDVVEYDRSGASKRPVLKHDHVVIEPLVY